MHETEQRVRSARETTTAPAAPRAGERYERYACGSPEFERRIFDRIARDLMMVQLKTKKRSGARTVDRAFHAKGAPGVEDARLRFLPDLPEDLRVGFAQPGAEYPVIVRFSNASGLRQPDYQARPARRGAAHPGVAARRPHDLLATNFPVSHARERRSVRRVRQGHGGRRHRLAQGLRRCRQAAPEVGLGRRDPDACATSAAGTGREVRSLATGDVLEPRAHAVGRGAGRALPAAARAGRRRPLPRRRPTPITCATSWRTRLSRAGRRLRTVRPALRRSESARRSRTRPSNGPRGLAPPVPVAIAHRASARTPARPMARSAAAAAIDELAFNPWNTTDEFRPLGNLNRARKAAYDASAAPPPRLPLAARACRCATGVLGSACARGLLRHQPVRRMAPAAAAARPAQPRRLPLRAARSRT